MKKIFTRLLLGAAVLAAPSASAYTVDEIIASSEWMMVTYKLFGQSNDRPIRTECVHLKKMSDTMIRFENVYGCLSFDFDLVTNGNPNKNGQELRIYSDKVASEGSLYGYTDWCLSAQSNASTTKFQISPANNSYYLTINKDENGKFYFTSQTAFTLVSYKCDYIILEEFWGYVYGAYEFWPVRTWSSAIYEPFEYNGTGTDTYTEIQAYESGYDMDLNAYLYDFRKTDFTTDREYKAMVTREGNNISIVNLGNNGYAINSNYRMSGINATLNPEDHTVTIVPDQQAMWGSIYYNAGNNIGNLNFVLRSTPASEEGKAADPTVVGTYTEDGVNHNEIEHHWVTNDGKRRTYEGMTINLPAYAYYYDVANEPDAYAGFRGGQGYEPDSFYLRYMDYLPGEYSNTTISAGPDVTVDVELVLDEVGTENGKVRATGKIVTNKNDMYVDHYELCVVPGRYTSINDHEGFLNASAEHGHTDATNIHSGDYDYHGAGAKTMARAEASANGHDYTFDKVFDASEVGSTGKDYTFFVKAVYDTDNHPGLTPTFHSMQSKEPQSTGIDGVEFDDIDAQPEYYNLQGVRVMEPEQGNIYIVRRGTSASKEIF